MVKREARRYDYILYPTTADRRKRTNGQRIVVGQSWYIGGYMVHFIYSADNMDQYPISKTTRFTSYSAATPDNPYIGYILASDLREYGRKV